MTYLGQKLTCMNKWNIYFCFFSKSADRMHNLHPDWNQLSKQTQMCAHAHTHTGCALNLSWRGNEGNAGNGHSLPSPNFLRGASQIISPHFRLFYLNSFPLGNQKKKECSDPTKATTKPLPLHSIHWSHILADLQPVILCLVFQSRNYWYGKKKEEELPNSPASGLQVFHTELQSTVLHTVTATQTHTELRKEAFWPAMSSLDLNVFLWWMLFCCFHTIFLFPPRFAL